MARIAIGIAGIGAGLGACLRKAGWGATDPVRQDRHGQQIRRYLSSIGTGSSA